MTPTNTCMRCQKPAIWTITAEKPGTPAVVVQYFSCDNCLPFAYTISAPEQPAKTP